MNSIRKITRGLVSIVSLLLLPLSCAGQQARLAGDKYGPIWSRDGRLICFRNDHGKPELETWFVDRNGAHLRRFALTGRITDVSAGGQVLFFRAVPGSHDASEIFSAALDGSGQRQLTRYGARSLHSSWSPDASRVAFITNRDGQWELYVMNADGSDAQNLSNTPRAIEGGVPPSWSPDGRWILFHSNADGDNELYRIRPDGSELSRITDNEDTDFNGVFSPDGKAIAFISSKKGADQTQHRIFVSDADGRNRRQAGDITPIHGSLSWSSEGDRIVFNSFHAYAVEIFRIGRDGSGLEQITHSRPQPLLETLRTQGVAEARRMFSHQIRSRKDPHDIFLESSMRRLGTESLKNRDYAKAIAAFEFRAEASPTQAGFWIDLAEVLEASGDRQNAIRNLKKSLSLNPPQPDADRAVKLLKELE